MLKLTIFARIVDHVEQIVVQVQVGDFAPGERSLDFRQQSLELRVVGGGRRDLLKDALPLQWICEPSSYICRHATKGRNSSYNEFPNSMII